MKKVAISPKASRTSGMRERTPASWRTARATARASSRILATLLPTRAPLLPDLPTLPEAGADAMTITSWAGLFGPAKMPPSVVERLARELKRALTQPDAREQLEKLAFAPQFSSSEELGELLRNQFELWRKAGKEAGIVAQ